MPLASGTPAPTFRLRDADGRVYTNDDFAGRQSVILVFYVLAFTSG